MSPSRLVICAFFFEYSVLLQVALFGVYRLSLWVHSADLAQEAVGAHCNPQHRNSLPPVARFGLGSHTCLQHTQFSFPGSKH